jgi:two-component system OmpR family response regulator
MKILLIEDDPVLARNINDALMAEGFECFSLSDGHTPVEAMLKDNPDCIVLDINLPGRNGFEICRDIRQKNTSIPVLFLTAYDELEDKVKGFEVGGDDYLTKPFYMKELTMRIQSLVRRRQPEAEQAKSLVEYGDMVLNPSSGKVLRGGQEIQLTPREFQILWMLVKARGEIVSKKMLVAEIWGSSFDANTNTIEVYINFLRKKIDKPFGKETIKTQFGFGYYLEFE